MQKFTDEQGREWDLTAGPVLNVNSAERVQQRVGVDLFHLLGDEAGRVFADPKLLVQSLYVLCEPQAEAAAVTPEAFGQALVGDAITRAADALMTAVAFFFPSQKRATLLAIAKKGKEIGDKMEAQTLALVQTLEAPQIGASSPTATPAP